jgi:glycolate oxidase FAD binding subunit
MVGSLGTLGGIATATLRVFPKPAVTRAALLRAAPGSAVLRACLDEPGLEPIAVAHHPAQGGTVLTFAGSSMAVDDQLARLAALAHAHGAALDELDRNALERCEAAETAVRCSGAWRWTSSTGIVRSATLAQPEAISVAVGYPTLGVVLGCAGEHPSLDAFAAGRDAATVFRAMPSRLREHLDTWGGVPPAFRVMQSLKANFDPKGLCNPGRFVGRL